MRGRPPWTENSKWRPLFERPALPTTLARCGEEALARKTTNGDKVGMSIELPAHITGTVWQVKVQVGDHVDAGQVLVILESMKMEMPVEAPDPGTVLEVCVEPGQAVEEGDVLVRLALS